MPDKQPDPNEPEVCYFDADMNPCPQEDAKFADVHEMRDGEELRYWLRLDPEADEPGGDKPKEKP